MKKTPKMTPDMPLLAALQEYIASDPAYFRIPAHRFSRGVDEGLIDLLGEKVFCADLTEAEGLDDLHAASGAIAGAERLAADLWGSEECHFLVNGSTCGNEAMLLACLRPGDKVLAARNVHKSVLMGLILCGAVPVWMQPEYLPEWKLDGPVSAREVADNLDKNPDCRAVILVSPTYYGVCSPLREIAGICHERHIPLLVDEAHGSHLYFLDNAPEGAVRAGADLVVQSIHKTGGSMTQSSLIHAQGELVDRDRLRESLALVMSTSPSYILMASLDGARHQLALKGRELMRDARSLADLCRQKLKEIPGISVAEGTVLDPLRVVFSAEDCGISGTELQDALYRDGRVSLELSDPVHVVAVITWGNTRQDITRLTETVRQVVGQPKMCGNAREDMLHRRPERNTEEGQSAEPMRISPEVVCSPRTAWYAKKKECLLENAAGKTAAESVIPYPPGIPVLCPGERITEEIQAVLYRIRETRVPLHGPADPALQTIRVLA